MNLPLSRGALCISIDLELLWGVWNKLPSEVPGDYEARERSIVRQLLELFDQYDAPVTWATVGRLFDDEKARAPFKAGSKACWFAPDVVEGVKSAKTRHDIGSHSYSHVYFDECSKDTIRAELEHARAAHERHGLPFRSLVFPKNRVAHLDAVADSGIAVYRSGDAGSLDYVRRIVPRAYPLFNLATKASPTAPPVVLPRLWREGSRQLVELPSSMLLLGRNGARGVIPAAAMRTKLRLGVARAAAEQRLFHLWFHPSNLYTDADVQLGLLESCLVEATKLRADGRLDIRTMADFATPAVRRPTAKLATGYVSRRPTTSDREAIARFAHSLNSKRDPDRFAKRWWWFADPRQALIAVDQSSGDVAAICAGREHLVRIRDVTYTSTSICDWFVSPNHQRKGLGVSLARELTDSCQMGTTLSISDDAIAGFIKLGWSPSPPDFVPFHVGPLPGLLARIVRRAEPGLDVEVKSLRASHARLTPELDELWNATRATKPIAMVRDRDTLELHMALVGNRSYRIAYARRGGRLVGYMLSRDLPRNAFPRLGPSRIVMLSDFLTADGCDDAFEPLLRATLEAAGAAGQDLALALTTYGPYQDMLARSGFLSSGKSALGLRVPRFKTRFMYLAPPAVADAKLDFYVTALDSDMDYAFGE